MNLLDTMGLGAVYLRVWRARSPARKDILNGTENDERSGFAGPIQLASALRRMEDSTGLLDSLPYYDDDLQKFPVLREKVDHELAKEGKPPTGLHPRVPLPIELFTVRELALLFACS
jgi:hypothetical protein